MDCMKAMQEIPDKFFELAICDPPYGIGEAGKKNKYRTNEAIAKDYKEYTGGDKKSPPAEYFKELFRISRNQIIFGANHFISKIPIDSSCWIVWDKENTGDFADCELAWTSFDTAVRKFSFRWNGMIQGDMKNKEIRIHPNQKPVRLYEWIISNYAKAGDKIIDTHAGSGSCCIAAHRTRHEWLGFELDYFYFEKANQRIRQELAQISIFDFMRQEESENAN